MNKNNNKTKKRFLAVSTIISLIVGATGCTSDFKQIYQNTPPEEALTNTSSYVSTNTISYNSFLYSKDVDLNTVFIAGENNNFGISKDTGNADRRLATGDYNALKINIEQKSYQNFINYVDSQKVIYTYEDYYNIDDALQMSSAQISKKHTNLIKSIDQNITKEELIEIIKANNAEYLKQYTEFYQLDENIIALVAQYIVDSLKNNFYKLDEESKRRVYCSIGNVKVIGFDSSDFSVNKSGNTFNAMYASDGAMIIDQTEINKLNDENALAKTIKHEINHIYQRSCIDQLSEEYLSIGGAQYWDNLKINPLYWKWYFEAAAESMVMTEYGTSTPLTYRNFVNYLRSADLVALLTKDYSETAFEDSSLLNDSEQIYKIFNANTLSEKKEIISMMYSIDYIQVEREDFEKAYQEGNDQVLDVLNAKYNMKASVCLTLSKYFYKNLADRIKKGDVSLQDICYLINVFEADLNSHIIYDEKFDEKVINNNKYFIENYVELQNNFFKMLASTQGYSVEELIDYLNNYAMVIRDNDGNYRRNCALTWLNESEKEYIYQLLTHNISEFTTNIRNITDSNPQNYLSK